MATAMDGTYVDRSYIDNFAVKDFGDTLLDVYYPDVDINKRTIGMVGFVEEQISNITEDVFNTGSVLFREMFPNRAEITESIYSHAAIFQLNDMFSTAASCTFLLVLEESAVKNNMSYDKDSGFFYFYIDRDTQVLVEGIPFVLDYDIELKIARKRSDTKEDYIYSAYYVFTNFNNSISGLNNPYIKIRRDGNGYISLEVLMHQCIRSVVDENIINNSKVNYPIIDIPFEGDLCGFDVMYRGATDEGFYTQLDTLPVYSQPEEQRSFCYYQLHDSSTLRLSFNSKDGYFMPDFNSEIEVTMYTTNGESGNFEVYRGSNIEVLTESDRYDYVEKFAMSAYPLTASEGGLDRMSLESLQALTVENYRTAKALTTEADLQNFFNNWKYRYGRSDILFTKLRDDIRERVYSAFMIIYSNFVAFKTNCLNLSMNLSEMNNPETNVYTLDPGQLFCYSEASNEDGKLFDADFLRDEKANKALWEEYQQAIKDGKIPFIPLNKDHKELPDYLNRPASFAEFKKRKGIDDKLTIFNTDRKVLQQFDDAIERKFLYTNPFLIRFTKNPNIINMYLPFIDTRIGLDFTGLNEDSYVQFVTNWFEMSRDFEADKKYTVTTQISPSIGIAKDHPLVNHLPISEDHGDPDYGVIKYIFDNPFDVIHNDLRIIMVISDDLRDICYTEMIPHRYDTETGSGMFEFISYIHTDDHITSDGRLRLLDEVKWRNDTTGEYYMETNDHTIYHKYDKDNNLVDDNVPVDDVSPLIANKTLVKWKTLWNMTGNDDILVPVDGCNIRFVTLYRRVYSEVDGGLVEATEEQTNNTFVSYDKRYTGYIWTNEYKTTDVQATFMYPLDYVRSDLQFMDYTAKDKDGNFIYDIMDTYVRSIPLVKWDLPLDSDQFKVFLNNFTYHYQWIVNIINNNLRNVTAVDVKWYNTYGRSKNYAIGDKDEILNTVNLKIAFDMWFVPGADRVGLIPKIKDFIKLAIERLNETGSNYVHVSNLMRQIETNFAAVDHIRFISINNYPTEYQSVKVLVEDINDLEKRERMMYVPEMLTIDLENIIINEYEVESY